MSPSNSIALPILPSTRRWLPTCFASKETATISRCPKPVPFTEIELPGGPEIGDSEIDGPAAAICPARVPAASAAIPKTRATRMRRSSTPTRPDHSPSSSNNTLAVAAWIPEMTPG